jgi:hypothetical protein
MHKLCMLSVLRMLYMLCGIMYVQMHVFAYPYKYACAYVNMYSYMCVSAFVIHVHARMHAYKDMHHYVKDMIPLACMITITSKRDMVTYGNTYCFFFKVFERFVFLHLISM